MNPLTYPNLKCHKCGNQIFTQKFIIKEISGLQMGTGVNKTLTPIPIFVCDKCGSPTEDIIKRFKLNEEDKII